MSRAWLMPLACCALIVLAACGSPSPPRPPSSPPQAAFNAAFAKVVACTSTKTAWGGRSVQVTRRLVRCAAPGHAMKADMACAVQGAATKDGFGLWDQLLAAACIASGGRTTRVPSNDEGELSNA